MSLILRARRSRLAALVTGVLILVAGMSTPPAALAVAPVRSNPVWMPVHTAFGLDCAGHNPGCSAHRTFFSIDVIPSGQFGKNESPSHALVYAMGGGTAHIGDAHGTSCGAAEGSFGTWLWIDHGHNVESRYGHLSKILVKNGTRVSAGTPIGVVGATGKSGTCSVNYLDFEIYHGALKTANVHRFSTLQACTASGKRQTWPGGAATTKAYGNNGQVHFTTWPKVPHGTQFPAGSARCIPAG